ncbi:hypothetical protein EIP91_001231 [Steccherinum ochraceum]|uniref:Uncharacterized protein n=1 Tax=Steccherinum ochraceum TaxID=92696 RepID=A0A4R0RIE4_9APHY|nr:hypothetical protein EIP91_001231 [Steccherinum ochraceum]
MADSTHLRPPPSPQFVELRPLPPNTASSTAVEPISRPSSCDGSMRSRPSSPCPQSAATLCPSPSPEALTALECNSPISTKAVPSRDGAVAVFATQTARPLATPSESAQCSFQDVTPDLEVPIVSCAPFEIANRSYERVYAVPKENTSEKQIKTIKAVEVNFLRDRNVPKWDICTHPEGRMYFQRICKKVFTNSLLTGEDDEERETWRCAEVAVNLIKAELSKTREAPDDTVIVIDVRHDLGFVHYYCASWERRCVFWLDEVPIELLVRNDRPVYCKSHLNLEATAHFWHHIQMFPSHGAHLLGEMTLEVRNILAHACHDTLTSDTSTSPYDDRKLTRMMRAVDYLPDDRSEYKVCMTARTLGAFYHERFLNYYGQPGAKLNSDDPLHAMSNRIPRSAWFWIFSPGLFWWPDMYLHSLETIWVDETVRYVHWSEFISALRQDWERSATPATVLLTANVGILAIQSVDTGHDHSRSVAQVASYASIMLCLANYIICQVLLRQHRESVKNGAKYASDYLWQQENSKLGLQAVAMIFSLPHALFVWSLLTFLASICWIFFWQTSTIDVSLLGALLLWLIVLVLIVIIVRWESAYYEDTLGGRLVDPVTRKLRMVAEYAKNRGLRLRPLRRRRRNSDEEQAADSENGTAVDHDEQ